MFNLTNDQKHGIGAIGLGLSQLSAGQPVNLSQPTQALMMRQQRAQQREALQSSGILNKFSPEQQAILAQMEPAAAQQIIASAMFAPAPAGPKPTDDMREYEMAVSQGFEGTLQDWIVTQRAAGATNVFNNTGAPKTEAQIALEGLPAAPTDMIWATDEDGFPIYEQVDMGNGQIAQRPVAIPLSGTKASETAANELASQVNAVDQSYLMLETIDSILEDPALENATGILSITQAIPSTGSYRFGGKVRQLQGQVFLKAYESLKGSGQITEVEGAKAEAALSRIQSGLSPEDFRVAARELREVVLAAHQRALSNASPKAQSQTTEALSDDELVEKYRQ